MRNIIPADTTRRASEMQNPLFNALGSFVIIFVGGAIFYVSPNWLLMPITALVWLAFEIWRTSKRNDFKRKMILALIMGLSLAIFDFVVENLGARLGYWLSLKSNFFILAVPVEIVFTCLLGGAAFFLLISNFHWTFQKILLSTALWSIGGTAGELYLNWIGFMRYQNGWKSIPHALASYIVVWLLLHGFYRFLNRPLDIDIRA
jgi:hypothetical protein